MVSTTNLALPAASLYACTVHIERVPMRKYIKVSEAAKRIGKTRSWVHQLIQAGRIKGVRSIGEGKARIYLIPDDFIVSSLK